MLSPMAFARAAAMRAAGMTSRPLRGAVAAKQGEILMQQQQQQQQQHQQRQQRGLHSSSALGLGSERRSRLERGKGGSSGRYLSSLPAHTVVPMPALSPTMETGTISKWNVKEGDKFEVGTALCEVDTDKATVSFDATEEGYIAKILVTTGEIKVGQPIMVTVEEKDSIAQFANFSPPSSAAAAAAPSKPAPAPSASAPAAAAPAHPKAPAAASAPARTGDRVAASPLARKLAREANVDLSSLRGTGPNGRIVAADVKLAPAGRPSAASASTSPGALPSSSGRVSVNVPGVYQDFELSELGQAVASRYVSSKLAVPHYYLSVEIDLSKLARLRDDLNQGKEEGTLSLMDFLVKATALAVRQVPDVNASWMDTFVRRYEQVDVNIVMGSGAGTITPVIRDAGKKGLKALSAEIAALDETLFEDEEGLVVRDASLIAPGTISIHNLGMFGVKAASPIILPPQACALAFGAVVDTVVPNPLAKAGEDNWKVAPIMVATLSCDHRVVDGAVAAHYLQGFKALVENPAGMIL